MKINTELRKVVTTAIEMRNASVKDSRKSVHANLGKFLDSKRDLKRLATNYHYHAEQLKIASNRLAEIGITRGYDEWAIGDLAKLRASGFKDTSPKMINERSFLHRLACASNVQNQQIILKELGIVWE